MGMEEELGSLQPWQIFSALYLGFWSLSCYFDHFLMTFVFCLAFGVMSEIATRYMNGDHLASSAPASAKEMEAAMMAVSRAEPSPDQYVSPSKDDLKDIPEDESPPPLPAKDYLPEPEEILLTNFEQSNSPTTVTSTSFNDTDPFLEAARASETLPTTSERHSEPELTSDDSMRGVMASSTYVNIDSSQDNLDDFSNKDDNEETLAPDTTNNDFRDDAKDILTEKEDKIAAEELKETPTRLAKDSLNDVLNDSVLDFQDPVQESKDTSLIDASEPLITTTNDPIKMSDEHIDDATSDSLINVAEPSFDDSNAMMDAHDSSKGLVEPLDIKDLIDEADSSKNLANESLLDFTAPPPPQESSPSPTFATSTTHNLLEDFVPSTTTTESADSNNTNILEQDFGASATKDILMTSSYGDEDNVEVLGDIQDLKKDLFDEKKDFDEDSFAKNVVDKDDGKLYAPDSSSDEELEAEYANREVNLEESESEEENGGYEFQRGGGGSSGGTQQNGASYETKRGISPEINDSSPEEGPQEHLSSEGSDSPVKFSPVHQGEAVSKGVEGTKALLDDSSSAKHSNSEIDDIDLTDPQLEVAATKIQSVFKGFQARKKMSNS